MDKHDPTEAKRFGTIIAALSATFRVEATDVLVLGYELGLNDLPISEIESAATRALRESKFMPSVAELRELAGQLRPEQRAAIAWSVLKREVRDGGYNTVVFDDPLLTAAVRALGGWEAACVLFDEEPRDWLEGVYRKRFTETYTALAAGGISTDAALPLPGYFERVNGTARKPLQIACDLPPVPVSLIRGEPERLFSIAHLPAEALRIGLDREESPLEKESR